MIGAIAGDIIGSRFEGRSNRRIPDDYALFDEHCRFTDDTVLTVATADAILSGKEFATVYKAYTLSYPNAGYGGTFIRWALSDRSEPYNSWGNGSAMRVSPAGFACDTLESALELAKRSAEVTHNHPEGIKGAQAVASAVFLARSGSQKTDIAKYITQTFAYDLSEPLDEIRTYYEFDVSCQGSVPQAVIAFLESNDFEDAVRKAISLGGDTDTIACITGAIAHAFYGTLPETVTSGVRRTLDSRLNGVVGRFCETYSC
jgi:ADP-ribosylglycohydrolase